MTAPLTLTRAEDVVTITLDRPDHANALSGELVAAVGAALREAVNTDARALVVHGAGRAFCSGVDLSDAAQVSDEDLAQRFAAIEQVLAALASAPLLTVACVGGAAVGAGADLAVVCDYRIGTDRASFRFPGARFGLVLGTHRLARLVGPQAARDLVVGQARMAAPEAARAGLLSHLVDGDEMASTVAAVVAQSRVLDHATMRQVLEITRDPLAGSPMAALQTSLSRPGLADRLRTYRDKQRAAREESRP